MPRKLKLQLPLALVPSFQLEAAGGEAVEHVDRQIAAVGFAVFVGVVGHQPDVRKVAAGNVVFRRDLARCLPRSTIAFALVALTDTKVPDSLTSHVSSRFSSIMFLGQLSISSPKSVNVGVAVKLMPPVVAPIMASSEMVAVDGVKDDSSNPAFNTSSLNTSSRIFVNFIVFPLIKC